MSKPTKTPKTLYRVISLLVALVMWINISGKSDGSQLRVVRSFANVPLVQEGVSPQMKLSSEFYQITVSLSGTAVELRELNPANLEVRLNLAGYDSGTYNIALGPENVNLPSGAQSIEVEDIQPRVVKLSIERKIRKKVPIILDTEGRPDPYFEVENIILQPTHAMVEGPESQVNELELLIANPIFIGGATVGMSGRVQFDYRTQVPPECAIVNLNDLTYRILIREIRKTEVLPRALPVKILPEGMEWDGSDLTTQVTVSGTLNQMEWLRTEWLVVFVQVPEGWDGSPLPMQATLEIPENEVAPEDWQAKFSQLKFEFDPAFVER